MPQGKKHLCPVEHSGVLDNRLRGWFQNPYKILAPYVRPRMTVLDYGCGPGFFTLPLAERVGPSGRVIASDLQEGMLLQLENKIRDTKLAPRIRLHRNGTHSSGLTEKVDFVLAFYLLHELPDQDAFFREMASLVPGGGRLFLAEPLFHVSRKAFAGTVAKAVRTGWNPVGSPRIFLSRTALLQRA